MTDKLQQEMDKLFGRSPVAPDAAPTIIRDLRRLDTSDPTSARMFERTLTASMSSVREAGTWEFDAEADAEVMLGLRGDLRRLGVNVEGLDDDAVIDIAVTLQEAATKWESWVKSPFVTQKAQRSRFHVLRDCLQYQRLSIFEKGELQATVEPATINDPENWQVFLVQHDWARLLAGSDRSGPTPDADDEVVLMPYPRCCFEFEVSGRHVIVVAATADEGVFANPAGGTTIFIELQCQGIWVNVGQEIPALREALLDQIEAICIMLEAEIVEKEVVRAPYRLNAKREREGKLPLYDHHIVRLSGRRVRLAPLEGSGGPPTHHKRLHFRRGHWRHYTDHKTWIKWMLVGDPDLGFVDKDYRL